MAANSLHSGTLRDAIAGPAEYMGQFRAFSRVLYELGLPHWDGFDFAAADAAYAEYV